MEPPKSIPPGDPDIKIFWDCAATYKRKPRGVDVLYCATASVDASAASVATAADVVTVVTSVAAVMNEEVAGTVNGNGKLLGR